MMMALGSCCLITCCNCLRVGAAVFVNYRNQNDPNSPPNQAQPTHGRVHRDRPIVVQHEWDPNNPDDPVFLVQPDGGVGLAYQLPGTPSAKSVPLTSFTEQPRRTPRERLEALRACACMAAPVVEENESANPEEGSRRRREDEWSNSVTIPTNPDTSQNRLSGTRPPSVSRGKTGSNKRQVEYCAVNLDEAVLAQSLADTAAVMQQTGNETNPAQHTAVAMLLEKDDSDDERPETNEAPRSAVAQDQAKADQ